MAKKIVKKMENKVKLGRVWVIQPLAGMVEDFDMNEIGTMKDGNLYI